MPRQNRVQPDGSFLAHPARGRFMGNRGILHDENGLHPRRRWRHRNWVCCVLDFKGRRRQLMAPGSYTELFFHDEAVALAAGHRPCAECRRADYLRFRKAAGIAGHAAALDAQLHRERTVPRVFLQRRHEADLLDLPEGTFVLSPDGTAQLLWQEQLWPHAPEGYGAPGPVSAGRVTVLTPPTTLTALRAGYLPQVAL